MIEFLNTSQHVVVFIKTLFFSSYRDKSQ